MPDEIDALFAGVDEFYPGSKRKRRAVEVKETTTRTDTNWDLHPTKRTLPNGKDLELFAIGALARALRRPIITIRSWMKEGHFPPAPYRLPAKKDKHGETHLGKRLYSRAMIEETINLFSKYGVLEATRIEWSTHRNLSLEITEAWNKIRATETQ